MVEVVRQSCKRMEARNSLRNRFVVWFTAVLTSLPILTFHIIKTIVYAYTSCFLPTVESKMLWSCRCRVHVYICCCSHINWHNQVCGHRTGSSTGLGIWMDGAERLGGAKGQRGSDGLATCERSCWPTHTRQ